MSVAKDWYRAARTKLSLLRPANVNTFNSYNNYTTFVDKPGMDTDLSVTAGNHGTFNQSAMIIVSATDTDYRTPEWGAIKVGKE